MPIMCYRLTMATLSLKWYSIEAVISEQQREAFATAALDDVCIYSIDISGLPLSLHKTCICFCDVLQVQAVLKRKEEEDQQMQQLIQTLQASLEKEKSKVKDLKEQVMGHLFTFK